MSTDKTEKLNSLLEQQQLIIEQLRQQTRELEHTDIIAQNESLAKALEVSNQKIESLESENGQLKNELLTAKQALFAKMADEKLNAFMNTQKKIDAFYYTQANALNNRLSNYERYCSDNITKAIAEIDSYGAEQFGDIRNKLEQLNAEFEERRKAVQGYCSENLQSALDRNDIPGSSLRSEPLQEIEKQGALKHKSFESFVGLNILGKAGILLFLIGIVMLGRFTYIHLSDVFKEGMIFLLGALLIGVGEVFFKKEKSVFSTVLISGGVSVLYAAMATGYFAFSLYSTRVTFLICVVITALAIFLSNQTDSQVVCAFGAIGGYMPVAVSYMIGFGKAASDVSFLPVSSIYFTILAAVVFIMSYNKKWHAARFIGYALQLVAIGGVAECAWAVKDLNGYSYSLPLAAAFSAVSFLIYLMYPAYMILKKKPMSVYDTVLLSLNTVSGAVSISFCIRNCFYMHPATAQKSMGIVFLVMTLIYAAFTLSCIKEKSMKQSAAANISALFTLAFSMLVVPLMFGFDYAPVAWAVEGVVIAYFSIERRLRYSEYAGLLCMFISAVSYIALFIMSDSSVTLSLISLTVIVFAFWIYIVRGFVEKKESILYVLLEILNSFATFFLLNYVVDLLALSKNVTLRSDFTVNSLAIIIGIVVASALRVGILKNRISLIFSDISSGVLIISALMLNSVRYCSIYDYYYEPVEKSWLSAVNIILLVMVVIGTEFFFSICAAHFIGRTKAPAWLFTVAVSVTSLLILTVTLMKQFLLPFASVVISAVYIAAACALLIIGFRKNYTVVRSGGLVLVLAAFAKLCFVDTSKLDSGWKIASYFAFGGVLITISYFYQRLTKKLEQNAAGLLKNNNDTAEN